MKHTKKMIMVPETEYLALLSMVKGVDYLQTEKANINAEIQKNLNDTTIPEDLKSTRHDFLVKRRRQIHGIIENKPQKVIIDPPSNIPSIAPYLGISKPPLTTIINDEIDERPKVAKTPKRKGIKRPNINETQSLSSNGERTESNYEDLEETNNDFETPKSATSRIFGTPLFNPSHRKTIKNYIEQYKDELKISAKGKVYDYRNNTIKNSDYNEIIDYLTGKIKDPPTGTKFLKDRLMKVNFLKPLMNLSSPMSGRGKRVLVKLKSIKTPGLIRHEKKITKFKPTIWAKI